MSILRRYFSDDAIKVFYGMKILLGGAGVARIVSLLSVPILTRIYSPADYGVLSIYTSIVLLIAPFLTLRYALAIPLPTREATAFNILALSLVLLLTIGSFMTIALWLFGGKLFNLLSMDGFTEWWWLVVLGSCGVAAYELMTIWATRKRAYMDIAKTNIKQSILGESIKITLGVLDAKTFGLVVGQIASLSGGVWSLARRFRKEYRTYVRFLRFSRMRKLALYYKDYPTYRLLSQALLIIAIQSPLLLAAVYFDPAVTGQLGLAIMALSLPANLLGETMSKAFYAEAAGIGRKNPDRIRKLTYSVLLQLASVSLVPMIILWFGGEVIFKIVFGVEWALAGEFASALSIYLGFQFIQKPVSYLMYIFDAQKALLCLNLQRLALVVGCFYLGYILSLAAIDVIVLYSVVSSFHYALSVMVSLKVIRN